MAGKQTILLEDNNERIADFQRIASQFADDVGGSSKGDFCASSKGDGF